jgi:hypothetical protein
MMSGAALLISLASLVVSILGYRSSGPRVSVASHAFSVRANELWLEVRLANAGAGEIDIDGATCDVLGPTVTTLPYRLKSGSSHLIQFRARLEPELTRIGSVTISVGLGNGQTLVTQVRIDDVEQAEISRGLIGLALPNSRSGGPPSTFQPPTQDIL